MPAWALLELRPARAALQLGHAGSSVRRLLLPRVTRSGAHGSIPVVRGLACSWLVGYSPPGTEPVSPALASMFFTTEPPGKPLNYILKTSKQTYRKMRSDIGYWKDGKGELDAGNPKVQTCSYKIAKP